MKERITYIHGSEAAFDPSQLRVRQASLEVVGLQAARDHQLTFGLEELPEELRLVLQGFDGFHLRWSSIEQTDLEDPFSSRISPGLHVFSSPRSTIRNDEFCSLLHRAFGDALKCISQQDSFTNRTTVKRRSPGHTILEYHQNLPKLDGLASYIQATLCHGSAAACRSYLELLRTADSLDIDYASSTGKLTLRAFHKGPPSKSTGWNVHDLSTATSRTEIGVLATQDATELDSLKMGGYLIVLGEDNKPKPTLFQFPSRHHQYPFPTTYYNVAFQQPSGLHPTMRIDISANVAPMTSNPDSCSLYTYLTLPSTVFPDKYQLSNDLLLESLNIRKVHSISGYTDLEAPDYAVSAWGSSMLIELAKPATIDDGKKTPWHADIPLHLRYLPPNNSSSGTTSTDIPWPVVFWACEVDAAIGRLTGNPFDRTHLGYDGHFTDKTVFYHLRPQSDHKTVISTLQVPVLNTKLLGKDARLLELGTGFVILAGWLWVVWLLIKGSWLGKARAETKKKTN